MPFIRWEVKYFSDRTDTAAPLRWHGSGGLRIPEQVLIHYAATDNRWDRFLFQTDLRVLARTLLWRVLWLRGFPTGRCALRR
jgi:hypothetical protein